MNVISGKGKEKETTPITNNTNNHSAPSDARDKEREEQAAVVVQRAWRHHSMKKAKLDSDARWKDVLVGTKMQMTNEAAEGNEHNDTKSRWRRGVFLAGRLRDGDAVMAGDDGAGEREPSPEYTKSLATQHWLELVDPKHRYGSNLKWYHQKWAEADTSDNFFKWLDKGDGKDLSLPECNRDQLESERIIYLSAEQRLNYLITIDSDGKIRWKHNSQYVDTTPGRWIDSGDGRGIVRADRTDEVHIRKRQSSVGSQSEEQTAKHYQGVSKNPNLNVLQRIWKDRFTTKGLMERMLRKTIRKNTWLYVADKHYNVFVGLKETGYFQHSSFTSGGLVTSAGLIEVKDGLVTSLSPLSGHYRTSIEHFKQFVEAMEQRGLDTHKVHVTKGEAMLWGLEHWKGFQTSTKESTKHLKHATRTILHPHKAREEKQEAAEKAQKEEEVRNEHEAQHAKATATTSSSLSAEEVKDQALREKIERMRKKKEQEDEQWKSGSQWRWEIITGRAQKMKKEQEQKWKSAMESVTPNLSSQKEERVHQHSESRSPHQLNTTSKQDSATVASHANPDSMSGSEETQSASSRPIPETPRIDPLSEERSHATPEERPPAYDTVEPSHVPLEKSLPN